MKPFWILGVLLALLLAGIFFWSRIFRSGQTVDQNVAFAAGGETNGDLFYAGRSVTLQLRASVGQEAHLAGNPVEVLGPVKRDL